MCHQFSQVLLERKEADVIFLDCTKAFDRLPHDVIVASLRKHGVDEHLLALFSDYLKGRSQRVMVDGFFSEEIAVKSGVPQGSILGPTFFTVAVNGLSGAVQSRVLQYADDIVLYRNVSVEEDCHASQEDLNNLAKWCCEVGLEINLQKSQHLRISNKMRKTAIPFGSYSFNAVGHPDRSRSRVPRCDDLEPNGLGRSSGQGGSQMQRKTLLHQSLSPSSFRYGQAASIQELSSISNGLCFIIMAHHGERAKKEA
ncbi:hypothetical protein RvY_04360-1 [Ramazzottius varieornatus]|uniref:Reverse transcriptase domain-containing protein n=1 Tax=Ramazzottius varieornatus TaxID=947166 RepID=A0A1D1V1E4_RAMVA|nr:hypothetical protein RvY_04360-1 [Ramazzottius varieornatus]